MEALDTACLRRQGEETDRGIDAETDRRTLGGPLAPVMPEMNKVS